LFVTPERCIVSWPSMATSSSGKSPTTLRADFAGHALARPADASVRRSTSPGMNERLLPAARRTRTVLLILGRRHQPRHASAVVSILMSRPCVGRCFKQGRGERLFSPSPRLRTPPDLARRGRACRYSHPTYTPHSQRQPRHRDVDHHLRPCRAQADSSFARRPHHSRGKRISRNGVRARSASIVFAPASGRYALRSDKRSSPHCARCEIHVDRKKIVRATRPRCSDRA